MKYRSATISHYFPFSRRACSPRAALVLIALLALSLPPAARANPPVGVQANLKDIGIDQNLGQQVPADLEFTDSTGQTVHLDQYFHTGKPVILTLVYFECPMLCTMVLNDLVRSLNMVSLDPGKDFQIVTVSFDPADTPQIAAREKRNYLSQYDRDDAETSAGWHFLTGQQAQITALTKAVGFRYHWDPVHKVFAHASGIMILTPSGKISRYFFGIDYAPVDLKLSLIEASGDTIGSKTDQILLYCCSYDPRSGRYSFLIFRLLNVLGVVTIVAIGSLFGVLHLYNKRHKKPALLPSGSEAAA